jgi:hypothetical protein
LPVAFLQKYTPFFFRRINFSSFRYDDSTQHQYQSPQQQYTSSNQVSYSKFHKLKFNPSLTRISKIENTTEKRRFLPAKNCQKQPAPRNLTPRKIPTVSFLFFSFFSYFKLFRAKMQYIQQFRKKYRNAQSSDNWEQAHLA